MWKEAAPFIHQFRNFCSGRTRRYRAFDAFEERQFNQSTVQPRKIEVVQSSSPKDPLNELTMSLKKRPPSFLLFLTECCKIRSVFDKGSRPDSFAMIATRNMLY